MSAGGRGMRILAAMGTGPQDETGGPSREAVALGELPRGPRRYLTGDADVERLELVVAPPDGNGDWYVSILPEGHKIGPTVRVPTSGARREHEHVASAVAGLYYALGGEDPDEERREMAAFMAAIGPDDEDDEEEEPAVTKPDGAAGAAAGALRVTIHMEVADEDIDAFGLIFEAYKVAKKMIAKGKIGSREAQFCAGALRVTTSRATDEEG